MVTDFFYLYKTGLAKISIRGRLKYQNRLEAEMYLMYVGVIVFIFLPCILFLLFARLAGQTKTTEENT